MTATDVFAVLGVVATLAAAAVTVAVTWRLATRRDPDRLQYSMSIAPLLPPASLGLSSLSVTYAGDLLPHPMFLTLDLENVGRRSIKEVVVLVAAPDATYVFPGYLEDVPLGYGAKWGVERTDADECTIRLDHLNPHQVVKARFLLDADPKGEPVVSCPMPDVELKRIEPGSRVVPSSWVEAILAVLRVSLRIGV